MTRRLLAISLLFLLVISGGVRAVETTGSKLTDMDKIRKYNLFQIISTYTTHFDPQETNRVQNIKMGAKKLTGTVVQPGEIFSFNQVVGPRKKERGFKQAPEIVNGEVVDGIGGGVCQVSSTLYNAVLLADLPIVERVHHSQPVSYVDLGRGAAVYDGQLDFKFKNKAENPVLIMARVTSRQLTISILGRKNRGQVKIITSSPEVLRPEVEREIDTSLAPGEKEVVRQGENGYKVVVKKIVKKEGKVVRKEIVSEDIYAPEVQIIKINPKE